MTSILRSTVNIGNAKLLTLPRTIQSRFPARIVLHDGQGREPSWWYGDAICQTAVCSHRVGYRTDQHGVSVHPAAASNDRLPSLCHVGRCRIDVVTGCTYYYERASTQLLAQQLQSQNMAPGACFVYWKRSTRHSLLDTIIQRCESFGGGRGSRYVLGKKARTHRAEHINKSGMSIHFTYLLMYRRLDL